MYVLETPGLLVLRAFARYLHPELVPDITDRMAEVADVWSQDCCRASEPLAGGGREMVLACWTEDGVQVGQAVSIEDRGRYIEITLVRDGLLHLAFVDADDPAMLMPTYLPGLSDVEVQAIQDRTTIYSGRGFAASRRGRAVSHHGDLDQPGPYPRLAG